MRPCLDKNGGLRGGRVGMMGECRVQLREDYS